MRRMSLGWFAGLALCGCWENGPSEPTKQVVGVRVPGVREEYRIALSEFAPARPISPGPNDWPWWRGPGRDGKSRDRQAPVSWSETKNVVWKTPVPGRGHSSPCVWGDRLFLATADEDAETQSLVCFDRDSGRRLWIREIHRGYLARMHEHNSQASATPACDGERVFIPFVNRDTLWVTATDLDGTIVWQKEAGPFTSEYGYGSSPTLHGSLVIVNGDNMDVGFVAALHRETGAIAWRTPRIANPSYATPIVAEVAGKPQLLLAGNSTVKSYDPDTGAEIWSCDGPSRVAAGTVACAGEVVFASGGYPEKEILAIRADGAGDVTASHLLWHSNKGVTYYPSPIFVDGFLYVVNEKGIATCFDGNTGAIAWSKRLTGGTGVSASLALIGANLYVPDEAGTTYLFKALPDSLELVAENRLPEGSFATPAVCGARIYVRTTGHLYCIGRPDDDDGRAGDHRTR